MATGDLIKLGTLYQNEAKQLRPLNPIEGGDIPQYTSGQTIEIRNTDISEEYQLHWREIVEGGYRTLVCDRVILCSVNWNDLSALGLLSGKIVEIDGKKYILRSMSVGDAYRTGTNSYGGSSPSDNEWDRWVVNEDEIEDLPKPGPTDLDSTLNSGDRTSPHNQYWNWYTMRTLGQEEYGAIPANSCVRGHQSAQYFQYSGKNLRVANAGWRPVLQEIPEEELENVVTSDVRSSGNNGGRKLVILDNGWLVALLYKEGADETVTLHRSKDRGRTWEKCGGINNSNYRDGISIVSLGNKVGIILTMFGTATDQRIYFHMVDVELASSEDVWNPNDFTELTRGRAIDTTSIAVNSKRDTLHVAWSNKSATYANTFNISYRKGMLNSEGGIYWLSVEPLTTVNSTTYPNAYLNPTISLSSDDHPIILYAQNANTSQRIIGARTYDGTTWHTNTVYSGGVLIPSFPSAVTDSEGVLHAAWLGVNSSSKNTLMYGKSLDNGITWDTKILHDLKDANAYSPSITVDMKGKIAILFRVEGASKTLCGTTSSNRGETWSQIDDSDFYYVYGENPSTLYDVTFELEFGEVPPTIYQNTPMRMVKYTGHLNNVKISTPTGDIGIKDSGKNFLTYSIQSFDAMPPIIEKINGETINVREHPVNNEEFTVDIPKEQWDRISYSKYCKRNYHFEELKNEDSWIQGTLSGNIGSTVTVFPSDARIATKSPIAVTGGSELNLILESPYSAYIYELDKNGIFIGFNAWSEKKTLKLKNTTSFIHISIMKEEEPVTPSDSVYADIELSLTSYDRNTLTIEMHDYQWDYTFDKRLPFDADLPEIEKSIKDLDDAYLPAIKNNLIDTIEKAGMGAPITPSWEEINNSIRVNPLAKVAEGTAMSSASGISVPTQSGSAGSTNYVPFDMTILDFVPSMIVLYPESRTANQIISWFLINYLDQSSTVFANCNRNGTAYRVPYQEGIVNIPAVSANTAYTWVAYD